MIDEREKDKCLFRKDRHCMVKPKYYLVERTLLPEVFQRVIEANEAIASGKAATASEAAKIAGLSRSAYYKYKDGVRPFFEDEILIRRACASRRSNGRRQQSGNSGI